MASNTPELVGRYKRLSFAKIGDTYHRMTKFTQISNQKSPIEYTRHYVDQSTESTDVVGYGTSKAFSFDRHTNTPVHDYIAGIIDDEKMGTEARIEIVTVDLFDESAGGSCVARHREYSIVPDTDSDGTDALIYSGSFKAVSDIVKGTATSTDDWMTCTFTEE